MKHSESIFGKKPQAKIDSPKAETNPKNNQSFSSSKSVNTMNKSLSSGSAESIFSVSKLDTPYTEDTCQIGNIFDKALFDQINEVDHIRDTERQLEEMKSTITDKKRLQKERNVLTA